jgi:hypothetical protein
MCRIDHLRVGGSSIPGKLQEEVFPNATTCPAHKPVINRRRRAVFGWAIAPSATAFQHVHDAADDASIICSLDTSHIRWQSRLNPRPLFVTQPKQVLAHDPDPPSESGTYGIRTAMPAQQN